MASIRKRGKTWHVQVRRKGFPTLTASLPSKAEAQAWAAAQEQTIYRGEVRPSDFQVVRLPLSELLHRYEAEISARKRGADRESFKIRVLLRSSIASLPVAEVNGAMIAAYRDSRLAIVKPGTVRREMALLRHCLEIARREWGIPMPRNPFTEVKLPSPANSRERRLETGDIQVIWSALQNSKAWYLRPMIELAIETGMRRGELLALLWTDVDLRKRLTTLPITKNGKSRKVPLSSQAVKILNELPDTGGRVFPITHGAFRQAWDRLMKRCGIDDLCFHDLRHEAISRFFELGLSVPEVALISGHRDYRMLFRYTHIRPEDLVKKLL